MELRAVGLLGVRVSDYCLSIKFQGFGFMRLEPANSDLGSGLRGQDPAP